MIRQLHTHLPSFAITPLDAYVSKGVETLGPRGPTYHTARLSAQGGKSTVFQHSHFSHFFIILDRLAADLFACSTRIKFLGSFTGLCDCNGCKGGQLSGGEEFGVVKKQ